MHIAFFEMNDLQRQSRGEDTILPEARYQMSKKILYFFPWLTMFWLLMKRLHFLLQSASNKISLCRRKRNQFRVFVRVQTLFKTSLNTMQNMEFFVCLAACLLLCFFNNNFGISCMPMPIIFVHIHILKEDNEMKKKIPYGKCKRSHNPHIGFVIC